MGICTTNNTRAWHFSYKDVPVTAEEKTNKKNDVKDRSLLTHGSSSMNNNFNILCIKAQSLLTLSSTGQKDWLCRLAILGVVIAQEELNSNFLNSLPPEWNTQKSVGASSGARNLAFMTAPSTSSTNDVNTAIPAYEVSTVSPNVNAASPQVSTASFSDNVVYAFMVKNPNSSNLLQQDLEQIHEDDLEVMDLKWQLSLLSMRAKREYRASRNKEGQFRNQDNTRKQGNNEDTSSRKMCDDLIVKLNQTKFTTATYKRGLATVEKQLIIYRKNEVLFSKEVAVIKREVACKDYEINVLKSEFENVKQEKEGIEFKIEKFDKASKDLDKLLGSQITNKSKKGLGYSAVPPPHPLIYNRPKKLDLSYSGLDEFKEPEFKAYGSEVSEQGVLMLFVLKIGMISKENSDESLVKEQVSKDTSSFVESSLNVDKETVFLVEKNVEFAKPKNHEKKVKKSVRLTPLNAVRHVNTAHPKPAVHSVKSMSHFSKQAQSTTQRPFYKQTTLTRRSVHTAKRHYYTERPREGNTNTARSYTGPVNAVRAKGGKPQQDDTGFVDSGCSRHMTRNIAYLSDFKEFDWMATLDELMLWHKRLGHINFKNINKLVKDNLVRGLPTKHFENDQTCVACLKEKQHRASCIKREYSVARTPQQNGVAERRNRTLIEAARIMHVKRGRDTKIPQSSGPPVKVGDEAVHKELGNIMEMDSTTDSSLEAEQNSEDTSSKLPDSNRYEQVNKRSAMAKVQLKEDHINFREVKALNKSKIRSRSQSITSKFEDHDQDILLLEISRTIAERKEVIFIAFVSFVFPRTNNVTKSEGNDDIIMVNVIPLDNDHDVPFVEPNQHDDAPVVPEPGLENEDEDLEEDEFEEEEDPQEDEDDMEIDIKEDENEPVGESSTAAIPREDGDRLLPGFMRRDIDSLFGRMVNFSRRLCGREMAHALVEKKGEAKDRFYSKLILDLGNKVRSSVEQGTAAMEKLVEKLENVGEKAECKKLKKEHEEAEMF
ncbi:putative ribonuclease H-like domain-containing protein [Tanacetum coccineum]